MCRPDRPREHVDVHGQPPEVEAQRERRPGVIGNDRDRSAQAIELSPLPFVLTSIGTKPRAAGLGSGSPNVLELLVQPPPTFAPAPALTQHPFPDLPYESPRQRERGASPPLSFPHPESRTLPAAGRRRVIPPSALSI